MNGSLPDPHDPQRLDDDVMHGLMAAHASESVGATLARVHPRRTRFMRPISIGSIAAILLMAVTLAVLVPLAIGPSTANASDVIGTAEAAFAEPGSRTYEIRITRWGGPVASRLMQGEITHVAGSEPRSFGYLEIDDSGKRVEFGRDAQGAWFKGPDGQVRRRTADDAGAREPRDPMKQGPKDAARQPGFPIDIDWMTLDSVLPRLKKGYDLQVVEYPRWKTLIARRQWMPNGIDARAVAERADRADRADRAESMRQGTQPDGMGREEGMAHGEPRIGQSGIGQPGIGQPGIGARRPNAEVQAALRDGIVAGSALRGAPLRVELEFAPDGRVIERARIELDASRAPRTIELRLKAPGEPPAEDDVDLGTWE
ncbi:MAG: hypothetical protein FJ254_05690 [Phycisphaerae bacterium]|nr:hypothetical protein [Phycisphaerae bacterium]